MPRALAVILLITFLSPTLRAQVDPATLSYPRDIRPLLDTYCSKCHFGDHTKGDVSLAPFATDDAVQSDPRLWRTVQNQLADYSMPPKSKPQPTPPQRQLLIDYLTHRLNHLDLSRLPKDPGRITVHRLNRQEYNNTLRDLLNIDNRPADAFPADGGGGAGFDNNADTLFTPPVLMEQYLKAAGDAVNAASPRKLFPTHPDSGKPPRQAARECLEPFLLRAFRRPPTSDELTRYLTLFEKSFTRDPKGSATANNFESSLKLAYKAILLSPNFLFRIESDNATNANEPHPVSDYALASRLSYFLWASMPDDELLDLAKKNKLHEDATLDAQVQRMLKDPRSRALAEYFGGQWLGTSALHTTANPDRDRFRKYTPQIRDALYEQSVEFVDSVFRENQSILTLIDSDYTILNEPLARYYGLPKLAKIPGNVTEENFRKVPFSGFPKGSGLEHRGGVLGLGAVHVITSFPLRTSPVLRGKWVLETLLGAPPPPPPPDVPKLPEDDAPSAAATKPGHPAPKTIRQQLEKHREDPNCAACHNRMDPIGFGLENFDPIGRWRTTDPAGQPVDAVGTLASGESFTGPDQLKQLLLKKQDAFARTLTQKLLSYALGRGLEFYDEPTLTQITTTLATNHYKSTTLITAITKSYPFRNRRG